MNILYKGYFGSQKCFKEFGKLISVVELGLYSYLFLFF